MMALDSKGAPLTEYVRALTPNPASVKAVCHLICEMIKSLDVKFERVSAGFPGVIRNGVIMTAVNMHSSWLGIAFQKKLQRMTGLPTRVANDADIQGLGDVSGNGVELVITLGTGVGSALFLNGKLVPNLELGHHPFRDNLTYEDLLGKAALEKLGVVKWRKNLKAAILLWQHIFNYDKLYIGGGNARKIHFKLPKSVKISDNIEGVLGGFKLWEQ
jgi:polyphosphate glucokinase